MNDVIIEDDEEEGVQDTDYRVHALRRFAEPTQSRKNRWDRIVIAGGEKFHVIGMHLATHSDFFDNEFFGPAPKMELVLPHIEPRHFQWFMETINGEMCVNDLSVRPILRLAKEFGAPTATNRCEAFLLKDSEKDRSILWKLSIKYGLESLKKDFISKTNSVQEIQDLVLDNINDLDLKTIAMLLARRVAIHRVAQNLFIAQNGLYPFFYR